MRASAVELKGPPVAILRRFVEAVLLSVNVDLVGAVSPEWSPLVLVQRRHVGYRDLAVVRVPVRGLASEQVPSPAACEQ